jgi:protein-tyrosine-phosphatase
LLNARRIASGEPPGFDRMTRMVGINEELKATQAAGAALSTNPNSKETIRVLRQAKYIAALAMTTLASDKPLNDARHAVVITLSDLVHALETDPAATQHEKIEQARGAIRNLVSALEAGLNARLRRLPEG